MHQGNTDNLAQRLDFGRLPLSGRSGADSLVGGGSGGAITARSSASGGGITARSSGEKGTPRDVLRLALGERLKPRDGDFGDYPYEIPNYRSSDGYPSALSPQDTARSYPPDSEAWSLTSRTPNSSRGELSARGSLDSLRYHRHEHARRQSPELQQQHLAQKQQQQRWQSQQTACFQSVTSNCHRAVERNLEVFRFVIMKEQMKMNERAQQVDDELAILMQTDSSSLSNLQARKQKGAPLIDELQMDIDGVCFGNVQHSQGSACSVSSREMLDVFPSVCWDLNFSLRSGPSTDAASGSQKIECEFAVDVKHVHGQGPDVLICLVVCGQVAGSKECFEELGPEALFRLHSGGCAAWKCVWPFGDSKVDVSCHVEIREPPPQSVQSLEAPIYLTEGGNWDTSSTTSVDS
eukprot:TRINITY_DN21214_c0_g1_i1.p1 TRINITY_DN21214_c0_g1~~TRINITY_DN21214_c0_g1_i1.p1  ORF type:complete len:407 (-),score=52.97 TRINITY_DN21214_c0_g1_i1:230-1450(-)